MKANYENKSKVSFGSLYEVNQQLMNKEPVMGADRRYAVLDELHSWIEEAKKTNFYMLLNNDLHDYTIFHNKDTNDTRVDMATLMPADVLECLENRGSLLSADLQEGNTWEFWIRNPEGTFVYYLFPYDEAVIEYEG